MFSETDRVYMRRFLGTGSTFLTAWPLLESAMTAVQSVSDGGARPDSSTENEIKGILYGTASVTGTTGVTPGGTSTTGQTWTTPAVRGLLAIEASIAGQDPFLGVQQVGKGAVTLNPLLETHRLRSEGRRLANRLAYMLGMRRVIRDVFSGASDQDGGPDEGEEIFGASLYW
jgi:hypothetical protein